MVSDFCKQRLILNVNKIDGEWHTWWDKYDKYDCFKWSITVFLMYFVWYQFRCYQLGPPSHSFQPKPFAITLLHKDTLHDGCDRKVLNMLKMQCRLPFAWRAVSDDLGLAFTDQELQEMIDDAAISEPRSILENWIKVQLGLREFQCVSWPMSVQTNHPLSIHIMNT